MSLVLVAPDLLTSAAADVHGIGSSLTAANSAAAASTTTLAAAAADEISEAVAALFARYGQEFQSLGAQTVALQHRFAQALNSAAASYTAADDAGALLLQAQQTLLDAVNAPSRAVLGRPMIGTGTAAGTGIFDPAITDMNVLASASWASITSATGADGPPFFWTTPGGPPARRWAMACNSSMT